MLQRQRFKKLPTLHFRLVQEAMNLRMQAAGMLPSIPRDELLRKAGQMDVAAHLDEWLTSPGLQVPT
ncbi:hypothetical protein ACVWXO_006303 [Bradyrhizobium sp. LM2.7]